MSTSSAPHILCSIFWKKEKKKKISSTIIIILREKNMLMPVARQADKESKLIELRTAGLFVYIISNDIKEKPGAPPF